MALNVLVVDDSPVMRKMVRRSLGICGLPIGEIHEAGNGIEALAVLGKQWVDVVLADINMPEMNGVELVEHMSADKAISKIPVIMVTSDRSEGRIQRLQELGVLAYLTKPFRAEAFRDVVEDLIHMAPAYRAEPTPELLAELAANTLEECVFVVARPAPKSSPEPDGAVRATISFEGPTNGVLGLAATQETGQDLAASMLGVETSDADAAGAAGSALAELANILCGVLVERLFGREIPCRLGIPVVDGPALNGSVAVTLVDDEDRPLWLTLDIGRRPPAAARGAS